jgi:hypothetical protein
MKMTVQDVERILLAHGICEKPSETLMKVNKTGSGGAGGSESEEDEDDDAEFGTMRIGQKGRSRGLRQGGTGLGLGGMGKGRRKEDSDSDFDM